MANFITDPTGTFFLSASWQGNVGKKDVNSVPPTPADASSSYWNAADANLMSGALKDLRTSAQDYAALSASLSGMTTARFTALSSTVHAVDVRLSGVDVHVSGADAFASGVSSSLSSTAATVVVISAQLSQTVADEQAVSGNLVTVSSSLASYIAYTSASLAEIPVISASAASASIVATTALAEVTALSATVFALNHPTGTGSFIIYVRTTGSDETGTGTAVLPYRTLQRALLDLPVEVGFNRYYIDITGITELLPTPFSFPRVRGAAPQQATAGTGDEPTGFIYSSQVKKPVNVFAQMTVLTASITASASATVSGSPGSPGTSRSGHMRYYFAGNLWPAASGSDPVTGSLMNAFVHASGALAPPFPIAFNGFDGVNSYIDVPTSEDFGQANSPLTIFTYGARLYASGTAFGTDDEGQSAVIISSPLRLQFAGIRFSSADRSSVIAIRWTDLVRFTNCGFDLADPANSGTDYNYNRFWNDGGPVHITRANVVMQRCHHAGSKSSGFTYMDIYECATRGGAIEIAGPASEIDNTQLGGAAHIDIHDLMIPTGPWTTAPQITIALDTEGNLHGSAIKIRNLSHVDYSRQTELTGTVPVSSSILTLQALAAGTEIAVKSSDLDAFDVAIARNSRINVDDCTDNQELMAVATIGTGMDPGSELSFTNYNDVIFSASLSLGPAGVVTGTLHDIVNDVIQDNFRRVAWVTGTVPMGV